MNRPAWPHLQALPGRRQTGKTAQASGEGDRQARVNDAIDSNRQLAATVRTGRTAADQHRLSAIQRLSSSIALPVFMALAAIAVLPAFYSPAHAVSIKLKDVAPDRIERQRKAAMGELPLPGTPAIEDRAARLEAKGMSAGLPVVIRIFKEESELELWMMKDDRFEHFATYPICHWSGTLGPKLAEGDKQAPEGFYTVTRRQMHHRGRWPRSLNLGFPNTYDRAQSRTGSYILVHGGCSSVGCFAMTNAVIKEIHGLTLAAIKQGQKHVPVHVFPFRMTAENMGRHSGHEWAGFWKELKDGYDSFERTRLAPQVSVCNGAYHVRDASSAPAEPAQFHGSEAAHSKGRKNKSLISGAGAPIRRACQPPVPVANTQRDDTAPSSPSEASVGKSTSGIKTIRANL